MQILVTRFHLLILTVTVAITGVGFFRVPADYAYPAPFVPPIVARVSPRA